MKSALPIVRRELLRLSRLPATFSSRTGIAAGAAGIFLLVILVEGVPVQRGGYIFAILGWLCYLTCLFAGVSTTSDCISMERREGTLGLLFLTDLSGFDVVLGKLAATSATAFYALVALSPVVSVTILLGGVTGMEILRVFCVLVLTLLFSLSAGILASTYMRGPRSASALTLMLIVLPTSAPFLLQAVLFHQQWAAMETPWLHWIRIPSSAYAMAMAFNWGVGSRATDFVPSLIVLAACSVGMLAWASLALPHCWQESPAASGSQPQSPADRQAVTREDRRRASILDLDPVAWLSLRRPWRVRVPWSYFAAAAGIWIVGGLLSNDSWTDEYAAHVVTLLSLSVILRLSIASEASRRFLEERRSGALELLLATSLPVKSIVHGHLRGLRAQFLGPSCVLIVWGLMVALVGFRDNPGPTNSETAPQFSMILTFAVDMAVLPWIGLWAGLKAPNARRAWSETVFKALLAPILVFGAFVALAGLIDYLTPTVWNRVPDWVPGAGWLVLGLGIPTGFALHAHRRMLKDFRLVASRADHASS